MKKSVEQFSVIFNQERNSVNKTIFKFVTKFRNYENIAKKWVYIIYQLKILTFVHLKNGKG